MATTRKKTPTKKAAKGGLGGAGEAPPRPQAPAAARAGAPESSAQPEAPTNASDFRSAIARRAYELYEAAGRPEGKAEAHWGQAEAEVLAQAGRRASRS
jgi:hypothetical protein